MAYKGFDLSGKVALVTGGNGGIGLGMAQALAESGSDVVIWGSNPEKNAKAEAQLRAAGRRVLAQQVDVSNEQAVDEAMSTAVEALGRLDTVIANAGISVKGTPFVEYDTAAWRKVMAVNLDGVFFTFRAACRHMVERAKAGDPGGSLMAISSLATVDGAPRGEHYAATKGALLAMVKAIAVEHARYGIRANSILPGWIATEMTEAAQGNDKFNANVISRVPLRRWGRPEDFGGIAVYFASDASRFHTGDKVLIDGGYAIY